MPTKDGTGVRDYIHIIDIAEGHLNALDYLTKNDPQIKNINLGTGKGTSVLELIKTFGYKVAYLHKSPGLIHKDYIMVPKNIII